MKLNTLIGSIVLGASLCTPSFGAGLLDRMLGMNGSGCDSVCCDTGCSAAPSCGCEISAPVCADVCVDTCAPVRSRGLLGRLRGSSCGHVDPSCGCEIAAPSCGCEIAAPCCDVGCGAIDVCGCDSGCKKPRRRPLMELVGKVQSQARKISTSCAPSCGCEIAAPCCDSGCHAAPSCGCEIAACDPCGTTCCDSACGRKRGGLLSKLFQRRNRGGCDSLCDSVCASSGCGGCSTCGGGVSYPSSPVAAPEVHGDAAPMPPAPIVDPSAYLQSNRRVIQATSYVR
jgi:hypothetical protein